MSSEDRIDRLGRLSNVGSLEGALAALIMLPIVQFFTSVSDAIEAIMNIFIAPLNAFVDGLINIVESLLGGPATILDAAAAQSARAFSVGIWSDFGPFAFTLGVAAILSAAYLLNLYLKEEETADLIPFSFTDIPFVGSDEDGGD